MQTDKGRFSTRTRSMLAAVGASALLAGGCVSVPNDTEMVHHVTEMSQAFSIGAISECLAQNCRSVQPAPTLRELDPDSISVLNWNILKGKRDNWSEDFRQFASEQDIVIIQEAMLHDGLIDSLGEHDLNWDMNTGFYIKNVATGVLTASRVKSVSKQGLRTKEPYLRLPKATLISRYAMQNSNQHLLVANIHSVNFTLDMQAYTAQIRSLQNELAGHSGPVILAGDFNSWSEDRLAVIEEMVIALSLQSLSYANHNRTKIFGREIDHVFYRGLEPVQISTREVTSSDHNPILVTFRMPQPSAGLAGNSLAPN